MFLRRRHKAEEKKTVEKKPVKKASDKVGNNDTRRSKGDTKPKGK